MQVNSISIESSAYKDKNKKSPNFKMVFSRISFGISRKSFLDVVEVGVSKTCNLSCPYCPNTFVKGEIQDHIMQIPLFKSIVANLRRINFQGRFTFHRYNEPLKVPVEDYIKIVKKDLPEASAELSTNGILLNAARLKSLNAAGVDKIIVTQHTPKGFIDRLRLIPDELLEKVSVKYGSELQLINRGGALGKAEVGSNNKPCYYVKSSLVVNSDGIVPLCCDDYYSTVILGDLKHESIEEVWNKPLFVSLRQKLISGDRHSVEICKNCDRSRDTRPAIQDFNLNSALYRKQLLLSTGDAHLLIS